MSTPNTLQARYRYIAVSIGITLSSAAFAVPGVTCTTIPNYGFCEPVELTSAGNYADLEQARAAKLRIAARVATTFGDRCQIIKEGGYNFSTYVVQHCANNFYVINGQVHPVRDNSVYESPPVAAKNYGPPATCGGTNPIHIGTGNKFEVVNVIPAAVNGDVGFAFYFNSNQRVGQQWTHSFGRHLLDNSWPGLLAVGQQFETPPPDTVTLRYVRDDGRETAFSNRIDWVQRRTLADQWHGEVGARARLASLYDAAGVLTGLRLTTASGDREYYDLSGRLLAVEPVGRPRLTLDYDAASGKLVRVSDLHRTYLTLTWDLASHQVSGVTSATGAYYGAEYGGDSLLAIVQPDETPADDNDNPRRVFLYEDARFPTYLTGITDENGLRTSAWRYDGEGRAVSSEHGGGSDLHQVVYNADDTTTVTDPLGAARSYDFSIQYGEAKPGVVAGAECAECGGLPMTYHYDGTGHLSGETDYRGNQVTYLNDLFGRVVSRTEADGAAAARTETMIWDDRFNRPLQVERLGQAVIYVYDDEGYLMSRTITVAE